MPGKAPQAPERFCALRSNVGLAPECRRASRASAASSIPWWGVVLSRPRILSRTVIRDSTPAAAQTIQLLFDSVGCLAPLGFVGCHDRPEPVDVRCLHRLTAVRCPQCPPVASCGTSRRRPGVGCPSRSGAVLLGWPSVSGAWGVGDLCGMSRCSLLPVLYGHRQRETSHPDHPQSW